MQNINKTVHDNLNELKESFENQTLEFEDKFYYESELINSNYKSDQNKINDSSRQHISKITEDHLEEFNNINKLTVEESKIIQEQVKIKQTKGKDILDTENQSSSEILEKEKKHLRKLNGEFQTNINTVVSK